VAALLNGEQIAIIRTRGDRLFALSNFDPYSKAFVIARGIVGDRGGVAKIASPIFKQNFSLETGECLDDPSVRLDVFPIRVVAGRVQVSPQAKDRE
jgi:nitrite reductase (NADH) small subunit